ncbi:aldehyde dehydrogenase family protein [Sphingomonas sp. MMS24-JH45]
MTAFTATIAGKPVDTAARLDALNPATEQVVGQAPDCGEAELDAAVAAARAAFPGWRDTPIAERQAMVKALGEAIKAHRDESMRLLTAEQGKPHPDATRPRAPGAMWCALMAIWRCRPRSRRTAPTPDRGAAHPDRRRRRAGAVEFPGDPGDAEGRTGAGRGQHRGARPSPFTPLTTLRIGLRARFSGRRAERHFRATGPLMTRHPGIDKISFTGSTATEEGDGERVRDAEARDAGAGWQRRRNRAARRRCRCGREQVFAASGNSGQICVAVKRLYVHADIYDRFATALTDLARTAKVGDGAEQGTRLGPMQNRQQYARVKELIADAHAQGYRFLVGGDAIDRAGDLLPLSLIDNPPEDSRIVQEEQFGPAPAPARDGPTRTMSCGAPMPANTASAAGLVRRRGPRPRHRIAAGNRQRLHQPAAGPARRQQLLGIGSGSASIVLGDEGRRRCTISRCGGGMHLADALVAAPTPTRPAAIAPLHQRFAAQKRAFLADPYPSIEARRANLSLILEMMPAYAERIVAADADFASSDGIVNTCPSWRRGRARSMRSTIWNATST